MLEQDFAQQITRLDHLGVGDAVVELVAVPAGAQESLIAQ